MSLWTSNADAIGRINGATTPTDLFGADQTAAKRLYRRYAKMLHPDRVQDEQQADANAAMAKLTALWSAYTSGDADRTYASVTIATRKRVYVVGDLIAQGDLAGLYKAEFSDGDTQSVVLKITRSPANNDLTENEAKVLRHLAEKADPAGLPYMSQLLDAFRYRDAAKGTDHQVNVLTPLEGWYTLAQVKTAYPDGLDVRDVAWMWKRLLIGVGHAHRAGVLHGAVVPEHVLIHPEQHGLCLVDWSYASLADDNKVPLIKAIVPYRRAMYAPEVLAKEAPTSATDIYMASKAIETLFNRETPKGFRAFIKGCTAARPEDAWQVMNELTDLLFEHFGPRKFRPFAMPEEV